MARSVRVEAHFEGLKKPVQGTGFRLAAGRTLTSQHVIELRNGQGTTVRAKKILVRHEPEGKGKIVRAPTKPEPLWVG